MTLKQTRCKQATAGQRIAGIAVQLKQEEDIDSNICSRLEVLDALLVRLLDRRRIEHEVRHLISWQARE
jgi:hypothetical protein